MKWCDGDEREDSGAKLIQYSVVIVCSERNSIAFYTLLGVLRNCKRFSQHVYIAQVAGHQVHVALFINHKLGHKAVRLFNAVLSEIARETEILVPHTTGATIIIETRMPHCRHRQVTQLDIAHLRTNLYHLTEHLVPNHEEVIASRRSAEPK